MKLTHYVNVKKTTFKCQSVSMEKSVDDQDIIVMELLNPIREVIGSQRFYTQDWGDLPMIATNVTQIWMLANDYPHANIFKTVDRRTHKSYYKITNIDGQLDVARTGKVWIKSESFKVIAKKFEEHARRERMSRMFKL